MTRSEEAEAIVRALAKWIEVRRAFAVCRLCDAGAAFVVEIIHLDGCPVGRADEWVRNADAEGGR